MSQATRATAVGRVSFDQPPNDRFERGRGGGREKTKQERVDSREEWKRMWTPRDEAVHFVSNTLCGIH